MAMRGVTSLKINGRPHPVNVYVTPGEGTRKGVMHGIEPHAPSDIIKASICFRTQGVQLVEAWMFGHSRSAFLNFFGDVLPRYSYYRGEKDCIPFGYMVPFCRACRNVGHTLYLRSAQPKSNAQLYSICGMLLWGPQLHKTPQACTLPNSETTQETTQTSPSIVHLGGRRIGMGGRMRCDPQMPL
ncbi:hypothetical protein HPB49_011497 [Dermacentor silvarum]|uniref:Uncharacterized protein n=1 Tax=Dermacentor silvarum TaxID=543639 RepID=A0ACB8CF26_DERSI|nr:hypothetical protein HPB49_011497 [Dermacentor silvarum]